MLGAALTVGVTPVEAKEIVYQAVPYVGHGQGVRLPARNERGARRARRRVAPAGTGDDDPRHTRLEAGRAVQEQIVGRRRRRRQMYATAPADEQHIQRLLSANCFGDYVTRDWARPAHARAAHVQPCSSRSAACEPQVRGHVAANLNVGNDRARLIDVLTQLLPFIGYPRTLNGLRVVDEAAPPAPGKEIPA